MGGINHQKWVVYYCCAALTIFIQFNSQFRAAQPGIYQGIWVAWWNGRLYSPNHQWGTSIGMGHVGRHQIGDKQIINSGIPCFKKHDILGIASSTSWREHVRCWRIHFFTWWLILACARNHLHHPQMVAIYGIGFTPSFPLSPQLQLGLLAHEFARCSVNPSNWSYETT